MLERSTSILALLLSLGLFCALYFLYCTVENSNHPLRGTYSFSAGNFSICAPGLFDVVTSEIDMWQCGELQKCFLQQNRTLSCLNWSPGDQFNSSTVPVFGNCNETRDASFLCLLNEGEKLGKCVSSIASTGETAASSYQVFSVLFI